MCRSFSCRIFIVCLPSLTALLDRPRGGTLAPAGRWACGRGPLAEQADEKSANLFNIQFCNPQVIDNVHKATGRLEYTDNLFICYTHKLQRVQEGSIKEVVSVQLRTAQFMPRIAKTCGNILCRNSAMYTGCLVKTAKCEQEILQN